MYKHRLSSLEIYELELMCYQRSGCAAPLPLDKVARLIEQIKEGEQHQEEYDLLTETKERILAEVNLALRLANKALQTLNWELRAFDSEAIPTALEDVRRGLLETIDTLEGAVEC